MKTAIKVPFLNWFENWCFNFLARSKRVGTIQVRLHRTPITFIVRDLNDPCVESQEPEELAPDHFNLERLFHLPAYGEDE